MVDNFSDIPSLILDGETYDGVQALFHTGKLTDRDFDTLLVAFHSKVRIICLVDLLYPTHTAFSDQAKRRSIIMVQDLCYKIREESRFRITFEIRLECDSKKEPLVTTQGRQILVPDSDMVPCMTWLFVNQNQELY